MGALAHGIADVAEHEEVARRGPHETREIIGRAGDEAIGKALGGMDRLGRGRAGGFDPRRQRRVDGNGAILRQGEKARGEVGIIDRQRVLDLVTGDLRRQRLLDGVIGQPDRIVLCIKQPCRLVAAGHGYAHPREQKDHSRKQEGSDDMGH